MDETNTAIPTGKSKAAITAREAEAVRLYLAGDNFETIAEKIGVTNRGTAYEIVMRSMKRDRAQNVGDIRDLELSRLDAMTGTLWPMAMGDLSIVPQFYKEGKKLLPVECDEEPDPDDSSHKHMSLDGGPQRCYVMPSMAKLEAIEKCLKLMKRRADYLGLDFSHGLDARMVELLEQQAKAWIDVFQGIFEDPRLNHSPEQKELVPSIIDEHLEALLKGSVDKEPVK